MLCSKGDESCMYCVAAGYQAALLSLCAATSALGLLGCCCGGFLQALCNYMRTCSCKTPCNFLSLPSKHFFLFMAAALVGRWMVSPTFFEVVGADFGKD